jgi:iron complex transport system substrate-binding protein
MKLPLFFRCLLVMGLLTQWAAGEPPQRVISMAPNLTESVFAIGAGDKLVGVTSLCRYPGAVQGIRRCGGWSDPNFEVITALKPDLILVQEVHRAVVDFAEPRGIAVCSVPVMDNLKTLREGILLLGGALDAEDGATSAVARLDAALTELSAETARHENRPRVFLSLSRSPGSLAGIMTVSGGSFMDEALKLAGGENIFGDLDDFYPQVSRESLIARRPEIILEVRGDNTIADDLAERLRADWRTLGSIPAVRNGRIELVAGDHMMIPGPRFPLIVRDLQTALYGAAPSPSESPPPQP